MTSRCSRKGRASTADSFPVSRSYAFAAWIGIVRTDRVGSAGQKFLSWQLLPVRISRRCDNGHRHERAASNKMVQIHAIRPYMIMIFEVAILTIPVIPDTERACR